MKNAYLILSKDPVTINITVKSVTDFPVMIFLTLILLLSTLVKKLSEYKIVCMQGIASSISPAIIFPG